MTVLTLEEKPTEFSYLLLSVLESKGKIRRMEGLQPWSTLGKEGNEGSLVEFICYLLAFYLKVCSVSMYVFFLEIFENTEEYAEYNLKPDFTPQI